MYRPDTRTLAPILDVLIDLDGETWRAAKLTIDNVYDRTTNIVRYDPAYHCLDGAYDFEPAIPKSETPVVVTRQHHRHSRHHGLASAFGDIAPDSWGIHVLSEASVYDNDRAGQLTIDGRDRLHAAYVLAGTSATLGRGALTFRYAHDEHIPAAADARAHRLDELPKLVAAARAFQASRGGDGEQAILLRDAGAASLGGARAKVPVRLDDGALGIAKLPSWRDHPRRHGVLPWEHVALTLAARAGIRTAEHQLKTIDGETVLVLRRFDRTGTPRSEGGQQRIGYISAFTLVGAEDPLLVDYVDIADAIAHHSPTPDADRAELYDRVIFNIAVGNSDDHPRNHGFLRDDGGWRLSPAFDINVLVDSDRHGTSFNGARTIDKTLPMLIPAARHFGITEQQAHTRINEIVDTVAGWADVAAAAGISGAERKQVGDELEARLQRLQRHPSSTKRRH